MNTKFLLNNSWIQKRLESLRGLKPRPGIKRSERAGNRGALGSPARRIALVTVALFAANFYVLYAFAGPSAPGAHPRPPGVPQGEGGVAGNDHVADGNNAPDGQTTPEGQQGTAPESGADPSQLGHPRSQSTLQRVGGAAKWAKKTIGQPLVQGVQDAYTQVNAADNDDEICLLAGRGEIAQVADRLKKGISVNARGKEQKTPLMHAAQQGQFAMVQFLLKVPGIDVDARDNHNMSASDYADSGSLPYQPLAEMHQKIAEEIARFHEANAPNRAEANAPDAGGTSE